MISIIANFYNSEKYINKLIKSVATQTISDWELICVNDCSPGNDLRTIKEAISKYNIAHKSKIISNKTNLGISKAKEVGIKASKGEYITFIDGDDWLANDALERMSRPMKEYKLDIVIMNHYRYYNHLYKKEVKSRVKSIHWNSVLSNDVFIENYLIHFFAENIFSSTYWGKMYRTELIKSVNFKFPEAKDSVAEDLLFNMNIFPKAKKLMFIDYTGYFWRYGGITSGLRENENWKLTNYIKRYAEIYPLRKKLIEEYNYVQGYAPLLYQSKNLLIWGISKIAIYDYSDSRADDLKTFLKSILHTKPYQEMSYLSKCTNPNEARIFDAIINEDCEYIYTYCRAEYKSNYYFMKLKSIIKKAISTIICH